MLSRIRFFSFFFGAFFSGVAAYSAQSSLSLALFSFEIDLNLHRVSAPAVEAVRNEFNNRCSNKLYLVQKLKLQTVSVERNRIDQGYIDDIWSLVFAIEYKDFVQSKPDTVVVQVTEAIQDRSGVLETRVDSFATHSGADDDAVCDP